VGQPATLAARIREIDPSLSWRAARERIAAGGVAVDGRIERDPAARPPAASRVEIAQVASARRAGSGRPDVRIIYSDADVAVVSKPAGILTVPFEADDRDTLLALARVALRRREAARGRPGPPTLRAVQRLDKETSGLVVFARSVASQRRLQEQFASHEALRRYLAIAQGRVAPAIFDSDFLNDRGDGLRGSFRPASRASEPPPGAKRAITRVEPLEFLPGATFVACVLETGRTHQIRIHLAEAGHPLLGEKVYVRDFRGPRIEAERPMLHAAELGFEHPRTGEPVRFEEEPPQDFRELLHRLRGSR